MKKEYALYKGDEFIDLGTKEYLAKLINVQPVTIKNMSTPTYRRRAEKTKKGISSCMIVVKIDIDDD